MEGTHTEQIGDKVMKGIAGGCKIQGRGQVRYEALDHYGRVKTIEGLAWLIEDLPVRLIPPQKVVPNGSVGDCLINGERAQLVFASDGGVVDTPFDAATGLPTLTMFKNAEASAEQLDQSLHSCVAAETHQNISPTQKETLRWHWKLGHPGVKVLKWLAERGLLGNLKNKIAKMADTPLCATCQYGKQTRKPAGHTRTVERPESIGGIKHDKLEPGNERAADQFEVKK